VTEAERKRSWKPVRMLVDPHRPDVGPFISRKVRTPRQLLATLRDDGHRFGGEKHFIRPCEVATIVIVHHRVSVILDFPKLGYLLRTVYFERDDEFYTQVEVPMQVFVREFEMED
jgi:hypothetical protein